MEYDYDKVTLVDDDGVEKEFYVVLSLELEDEHKIIYVIADPDTMDDDEPYYDAIYCYSDNEDDLYFVEDPEELDLIEEVLNSLPE